MQTAHHRVLVTARDVAILKMAYFYNGVTIEHIHRRFFPNASPNAYYRRVRKLVNEQYLRISRGYSLSPLSGGLGLITVGRQSRPMLADVLGLPRNELQRATRAVSPFIIPHRAAIGDFHLSLELATELHSTVKLSEWRSEVELASSPIIVSEGKKTKIIPDARLTLTTAAGSLSAYLEMDMGTIGTRLRLNLRAYLLHRRSLDSPCPVLYVVPDGRRRQTIASWALAEAEALGADPTIFLIALKDTITEQAVLTSPIWQVVGGPSAQALFPTLAPRESTPFIYGEVLERHVG
jgi:hypothetical protein